MISWIGMPGSPGMALMGTLAEASTVTLMMAPLCSRTRKVLSCAVAERLNSARSPPRMPAVAAAYRSRFFILGASLLPPCPPCLPEPAPRRAAGSYQKDSPQDVSCKAA